MSEVPILKAPRACRKDHVLRVAAHIERLPPGQLRNSFLACVTASGLMIDPFFIRTMSRIVAFIRRWPRHKVLRVTLDRMDARGKQGFGEDIHRSLVDHIRNGKDREDTDSVGGLSQREMDHLMSLLFVHNLTVEGGVR